jgi:hypothetical protein
MSSDKGDGPKATRLIRDPSKCSGAWFCAVQGENNNSFCEHLISDGEAISTSTARSCYTVLEKRKANPDKPAFHWGHRGSNRVRLQTSYPQPVPQRGEQKEQEAPSKL